MEIHIHVHQAYASLADQLKDVNAEPRPQGKIPMRKSGESPSADPRSLRIEALAEALRKHEEFMEMFEEAQGKVSDFRWNNASGTGNVDESIKDQAKATKGY